MPASSLTVSTTCPTFAGSLGSRGHGAFVQLGESSDKGDTGDLGLGEALVERLR